MKLFNIYDSRGGETYLRGEGEGEGRGRTKYCVIDNRVWHLTTDS